MRKLLLISLIVMDYMMMVISCFIAGMMIRLDMGKEAFMMGLAGLAYGFAAGYLTNILKEHNEKK